MRTLRVYCCRENRLNRILGYHHHQAGMDNSMSYLDNPVVYVGWVWAWSNDITGWEKHTFRQWVTPTENIHILGLS